MSGKARCVGELVARDDGPRAAPRPALWAAQALYPSVRCSPEPMGLVLAGLRGELGRGGRAAARHRWHLAHEAGTERRVHRRAEHAAHLVVANLDDGAALTEVKLGVGVGVRVGVGSVARLGWVQVQVGLGLGWWPSLKRERRTAGAKMRLASPAPCGATTCPGRRGMERVPREYNRRLERAGEECRGLDKGAEGCRGVQRGAEGGRGGAKGWRRVKKGAEGCRGVQSAQGARRRAHQRRALPRRDVLLQPRCRPPAQHA